MLHAVNNSVAFGASQDWDWEIAPLLVVMDRKPQAANPRGVSIRELFREDPALFR